jgi:hypothetical protein
MKTWAYIGVFALGIALLTALFFYTPRSPSVAPPYVSGTKPG